MKLFDVLPKQSSLHTVYLNPKQYISGLDNMAETMDCKRIFINTFSFHVICNVNFSFANYTVTEINIINNNNIILNLTAVCVNIVLCFP